jgi:hypothetical protein
MSDERGERSAIATAGREAQTLARATVHVCIFGIAVSRNGGVPHQSGVQSLQASWIFSPTKPPVPAGAPDFYP